MVASNYDDCETRVLAHEGGYTNNPRDPGGPTNWGITLADARHYWKQDATAADVRSMPKSVAMTIYRQRYWAALDCDELPSGVDDAIFDYGVNSGVARAGAVLRLKLGLPGKVGTLWKVDADVVAAADKADPLKLVDAICDERLAFLKRLPTWGDFGKGWKRRVAEVKSHSEWLAGHAPKPPTPAPAPGRGIHPDPSAPQPQPGPIARLFDRIRQALG